MTNWWSLIKWLSRKTMASEHCEFYETWYKLVWIGVTEIQTPVGVQGPALYQF